MYQISDIMKCQNEKLVSKRLIEKSRTVDRDLQSVIYIFIKIN